jgi:hypothetical protein
MFRITYFFVLSSSFVFKILQNESNTKFVFDVIEQPRQKRKTMYYDDDERPSTSRSRRSRQKGYGYI